MGFYRDTAVVLRCQKLGEADRIVTLLTQRHGKVRAVAKGVRRTSSRFGARVEPFAHVDVQLHTGRSLDIVTQVQTVDAFGQGLTGDYPRYTAGCALLETADRLTSEEGEPARELFLLLVGGLRGLAGGRRDPHLVLDAFLLRAMVVAGWAPAITECARCGTEGERYHRRFAVAAGGAVCERCRPPGSVVPSHETWMLLEALRDGDWATAETTPTRARRDASGLVAAHLQWHLERTLRSLPLVDRRDPEAPPRIVLGDDDHDDPDGAPAPAPSPVPAPVPSPVPTEGAHRSVDVAVGAHDRNDDRLPAPTDGAVRSVDSPDGAHRSVSEGAAP